MSGLHTTIKPHSTAASNQLDARYIQECPISATPTLLHHFKLENNLYFHWKYYKAIDTVSGFITQIPNFHELRIDPELTKLACNLVEILISKKCKSQIDKKTVAIEGINKAFSNDLSPAELEILGSQIEFLHHNGQIKAVSNLSRFGTYLKKNFRISLGLQVL